MPTQKTVVVLPGPTGPTGTFKGVNILSAFTGASGELPQWQQATGASGPNGVLEKVYNIGPTGIKGQHKNVIITGFNGGGGATGSSWNAADAGTLITLSNGNMTAAALASNSPNFAGVRGTKSASAGKLYLEFNNVTLGNGGASLGLANSGANLNGSNNAGNANIVGIFGSTGNFVIQFAGSMNAAPDGNTVRLAIDFTTGLYWMAYGSGLWNPDTGSTADPVAEIDGKIMNGLSGFQAVAPPLFPWAFFDFANGSVTLATILSQFQFPIPTGYSAWG